MNPSAQLLLDSLRQPPELASVTESRWNTLLPLARQTGVLGKLAVILHGLGLCEKLPHRVQPHMLAMEVVAREHNRIVRWEVNRIQHALEHLDCPVILLKGAAYVMAQLPPGRGRLVSDVDILVPFEALKAVEQALLEHGWEHVKLHPYDQRYYRQWMHELPPLRHTERGTVIDVHHTILPTTGRLRPDPQVLFQAARPVEQYAPFRILAPADMVLHTSVHLFQDGEIASGLRDLTDLDDLLRCFSQTEPGFWDQLIPRARQLGLQRPLYYALRFTRKLLGTPTPEHVLAESEKDRPPWAVAAAMDGLVSRAIVPDPRDHESAMHGLARWLLYVRSHWLRMPPRLLVPHLFHKATRRWKREEEKEDDDLV